MTLDSSTNESILEAARIFVQDEASKHSDGHDWTHIQRVTALAVRLARHMGADPFVCELAALLHDVPDEKLNDSLEAGMAKLNTWLDNQPLLEPSTREVVVNIISTISYAGGQGAQSNRWKHKWCRTQTGLMRWGRLELPVRLPFQEPVGVKCMIHPYRLGNR